jgi:uncharacterized protein (DUF433 family)
MSTTIDPKARIAGTRITVYDVLTYAEAGWHPSSIAATLGVSTAQVESALEYISQHEEEVLAKYRLIVERIGRGNPPSVEAKRRRSHEHLLAQLKEIEQRASQESGAKGDAANGGNHGRP